MKNALYYHDLAVFVLTELASKGRTVRPQELTTPTRQKILDCFKDAGWIETFEGTRPFRRSWLRPLAWCICYPGEASFRYA